jgi:hypothetical protein
VRRLSHLGSTLRNLSRGLQFAFLLERETSMGLFRPSSKPTYVSADHNRASNCSSVTTCPGRSKRMETRKVANSIILWKNERTLARQYQ